MFVAVCFLCLCHMIQVTLHTSSAGAQLYLGREGDDGVAFIPQPTSFLHQIGNLCAVRQLPDGLQHAEAVSSHSHVLGNHFASRLAVYRRLTWSGAYAAFCSVRREGESTECALWVACACGLAQASRGLDAR